MKGNENNFQQTRNNGVLPKASPFLGKLSAQLTDGAVLQVTTRALPAPGRELSPLHPTWIGGNDNNFQQTRNNGVLPKASPFLGKLSAQLTDGAVLQVTTRALPAPGRELSPLHPTWIGGNDNNFLQTRNSGVLPKASPFMGKLSAQLTDGAVLQVTRWFCLHSA